MSKENQQKILKIKLKDIFNNISGCWECDFHETFKIKNKDLKFPRNWLAKHSEIYKLFKPDLNEKLEINISKNYSAEDEINVYTKNEVKRKSMINNFQDILNWNYQKQGFLYLYCGKISNLIKDNPWKDVDMYIECGKSTNKQLEYYACFF